MSDTLTTVRSHLSMGRVALTVNDLDAIGDYYQKIVGLHLLERDGESARLGAGDATLLELRLDRSARRRSKREAGLFHTAFLLPARADLGAWLQQAIETSTRLTGASDHAVSEAVYLSDPEGNGIEIYVDRPRSEWKRKDGLIEMVTEKMDIEDLLASAGDRAWNGFTDGSTVGHVHLQVGDIPEAEAFYSGIVGLDVTSHYPGAVFYAADGYHHHIATNIWNSSGAPRRDFPSTGLAEVEIVVDSGRAEAISSRARAEEAKGDFVLSDPWGNPVAFVTR